MRDEIRDLINILAPKWTVEVLAILAKGPHRYTDIEYELNLSKRGKVYSTALTPALVHLQEEGLIAHDHDHRHAYRITPDGLELHQELGKIAGWRRRRRRSGRP